MDNDDAIVGTILTRRDAFALFGKVGAGLAFGGLFAGDADAVFQTQAHRSVKLVASPALTEGPFFVDEKLNRSDLIGDTKRAAVVDAVPLALELTVYRLADGKYTPFEGLTVDVWHCDAHGVYSDENQPMNFERTGGQKWLRGYQTTDAKGNVAFSTIFPGWYQGRTTHIHFKVRQKGADGKTKEFTSQLFFDDKFADAIFAQAPYRTSANRDVRNENDDIFGDPQVDGTVAGQRLMPTVTKAANGKGYVAKFAIALTEASLQAGGRRGTGGPGGPPPDGFGGPPPDWP